GGPQVEASVFFFTADSADIVFFQLVALAGAIKNLVMEFVVLVPYLGRVRGHFLAIDQKGFWHSVETAVVGRSLNNQCPFRLRLFGDLEVAHPMMMSLRDVEIVRANETAGRPAFLFFQGSLSLGFGLGRQAGKRAWLGTIFFFPNHFAQIAIALNCKNLHGWYR